MKRTAITIFFIIISAVLLNSQIFSNWNFEQWTGSDPDGWTLTPAGTDVTFSQSMNSEGYGGIGYALIITANSNGSGDDGQMEATVTGISAGQNITLSVYTKQGSEDENNIWVRFWDCRFFNSNDVQVGDDYDEFSYSSGDNTDWLKYEGAPLVAPTDAVKLRVNFRIYVQSGFTAGDIIYVDDLMINDTPLPVNLSSFYALYLGGTPTLYWTTQSEESNDYWNVYRSNSDNFMEAAMLNENDPVPGNGTTNSPSDYIYVDTAPVVQNTTYWYWIEDVSTDGETEVHEPITLTIPYEDAPITPDTYGLQQNYPNPFNPSTLINFALAEESDVQLIIYNVKGEKIKSVFSGHIYADEISSAVWDGNDKNGKQVSSGVYFYKLITDTKVYSMKMLLVK